jgi:hypothetical protein
MSDGNVTSIRVEGRPNSKTVTLRLQGTNILLPVITLTRPITKSKLVEGEEYEEGMHGVAYLAEPYDSVSIEFSEDGTRAILSIVLNSVDTPIRYYSTSPAIGRKFMEDMDQLTVLRDVAEVVMGPRRGIGPETETGKTPRKLDFEPLPQGLGKTIGSFLGGKSRKQKKKKVSRRKKTRRHRK